MTEKEKFVNQAIKLAISSARPRLSVAKVAEQAEISPNRLAHITQFRTPANDDDIERIRYVLDMPHSWPFADPYALPTRHEDIHSFGNFRLIEVPVVGSIPEDRPFNHQEVAERGAALIPDALASNASKVFYAVDDAMMPIIERTDLAIIQPADAPFNRGIRLVRDGDDFLLRATVYSDGNWFLASTNPRHPRIKLTEKMEVLGRMVGIYTRRGYDEVVISNPSGMLAPMF